ncbi:putative ACR [Candidatus Gugararchaeum adminiculabundum]|nr:putative ACR [Candidatus Gugararchaeum adminiculabundum]
MKAAAVAIFLALIFIFGCASTNSQSEMSGGKELRDFNGTKILVEIADKPTMLEQGLMGRTELCDNCGMLFVYNQDVQDGYWMRGMRMRIDIAFLDENYRPVKIYQNLPVCEMDPCQIYYPGKPYRYVLEVNANKSREIFGS